MSRGIITHTLAYAIVTHARCRRWRETKRNTVAALTTASAARALPASIAAESPAALAASACSTAVAGLAAAVAAAAAAAVGFAATPPAAGRREMMMPSSLLSLSESAAEALAREAAAGAAAVPDAAGEVGESAPPGEQRQELQRQRRRQKGVRVDRHGIRRHTCTMDGNCQRSAGGCRRTNQ